MNGAVAPEIISGEVKVQILEGRNILEQPGKAIPFIVLTVSHYDKQGNKQEKPYTSPVFPNYRKLNKFDWAARVPFIKVDKNIYVDALKLSYYIQSGTEKPDIQNAQFIGECFIPWKGYIGKPNTFNSVQAALTDVNKKSKWPAQGQVNIHIKYIPVGTGKQ